MAPPAIVVDVDVTPEKEREGMKRQYSGKRRTGFAEGDAKKRECRDVLLAGLKLMAEVEVEI